eukprot:s407_g12.t1
MFAALSCSQRFWLPSEVEVLQTAQDAILEEDNRELGILVVASGEGDTGNSVQVKVEHFAAVCVPLNSCWWPDGPQEEPFPEPSGRLPWPELRLLPEAAAPSGEGIMSSFGPLEVWMQSEVPSPLTSPARPADLRSPGSKSSSIGPMIRHAPARPAPPPLDLEARSSGGTFSSLLKAPQSPLDRLVSEDNKKTALQCLARGEAVEGQLVETRALQMMLLWEPDKVIGIRLESVFVNVPLELIRWWRGFKEHTLSFLEFGRLGSDLLQAPQTASHWAAPMQLPASRGPLRPQLDQGASRVKNVQPFFQLSTSTSPVIPQLMVCRKSMPAMRRLVLPAMALLAGKASLSAAMSEPGAPGAKAPGFAEMHEKLMESVEYSQAVSTMSEIMAQAESEARDFVEQKAAELGEDGAFDAALMEAFVAFDSDDDGKLIGQAASRAFMTTLALASAFIFA